MPKISDRLAALEKLVRFSGRRPPGLSDSEFADFLCRMTRPQLGTYLRSLRDMDLDAGIACLQVAVDAKELQHGNS